MYRLQHYLPKNWGSIRSELPNFEWLNICRDVVVYYNFSLFHVVNVRFTVRRITSLSVRVKVMVRVRVRITVKFGVSRSSDAKRYYKEGTVRRTFTYYCNL